MSQKRGLPLLKNLHVCIPKVALHGSRQPGYGQQKAFDDALVELDLFDFSEYGSAMTPQSRMPHTIWLSVCAVASHNCDMVAIC